MNESEEDSLGSHCRRPAPTLALGATLVESACVRLANPCPPSRVLKPYPLTLLVGADDRLSGSAALYSRPGLLLGAWVPCRYICGLGCLYPSGLSKARACFRISHLGRRWLSFGPGRSSLAVNPARRGPAWGGLVDCAEGETHRNNVLCSMFARESNDLF